MNNWSEYLKFRDGFASILDERFYPLWWLDDQVRSGAFRLWASDKAAILAELKTYPGGAVEVHFMAATGDLAEILHISPMVEAWGRENGAVIAAIESRPGWARLKKDYFVYQVALRKELQ